MAVAFFIAVRVFVGFPNDNGHRVLPHMKRNTQRPIPPFGSGSRNSRQLPFFTSFSRLSYSMLKDLSYTLSLGVWGLPACLIQCSERSALVSGMIGLNGFVTVINQLWSRNQAREEGDGRERLFKACIQSG